INTPLEFSSLSLHDALPIFRGWLSPVGVSRQRLNNSTDKLLLAPVLLSADANDVTEAELVKLGGLRLERSDIHFIGDQHHRLVRSEERRVGKECRLAGATVR